jgi:hypothetical protein
MNPVPPEDRTISCSFGMYLAPPEEQFHKD